jgi:hypothetical protein
MVVQGKAEHGSALLSSYDAERRPAGQQVVDRASASYRYGAADGVW